MLIALATVSVAISSPETITEFYKESAPSKNIWILLNKVTMGKKWMLVQVMVNSLIEEVDDVLINNSEMFQ